MRDAKTTSNPEGWAGRWAQANKEFDAAWAAVKVADELNERLLAQFLLSFWVRQHLAFETALLHDLILLACTLDISKRRQVGRKR